jgi:hypothetical protein
VRRSRRNKLEGESEGEGSLGSLYLVSDFSQQCVALNKVYSIKFDKVAISKWVTA